MARTDHPAQAVSLLPFLQPSNHAPRLVLSQGATDASYPFAVVDNSAPFSLVIRGSFRTDSGSLLKDVFLILQRDQYRLGEFRYNTVTNPDIETCWQDIHAQTSFTVGDDAFISLTTHSGNSEGISEFAPLLFCREKKLFLPLLCPCCGRKLELCRDDELLQQKGLHSYMTSARRYLYCASCSGSGVGEFFVREREDTDPLFLSDSRDLIDRLRLLVGGVDATGTFPCASCEQRGACFGPDNLARIRLIPFSFYPFHMLIVDAPALNTLDFVSLLSGATCGELSGNIDRRAFPGRIASLSSVEDAGPVTWTNFTMNDERAFIELLFLKLSLLEEVVGRFASNAITPPSVERVWVYLPRVCRNLPMGWNFRLMFTDDLTPMPPLHSVERNPSLALARTGLFYFQILLGSREVAGSSIVEAVRQHLSPKGEGGGEAAVASLLRSLCVPANIFRNPVKSKISREHEECWDKACAAGFDLLDAVRGNGLKGCAEIQHSLQELVQDTRCSLFTPAFIESGATVTASDDEQAKVTIRRVVKDMLNLSRAEAREKPPVPTVDRSDEVVETIIMRAGVPPEPLALQAPSSEDVATVIISSAPPAQKSEVELAAVLESELHETVMLSSQRSVIQSTESPVSHPPSSALPQPSPVPEQEEDLAETVMIIPPVGGRQRPGGTR